MSALNTAVERYEIIGDEIGAMRVQDTLGMVYLDVGDRDEALFRFQTSYTAKTHYNDRTGRAITAGNIGRLYLQGEEYEKARTFLQEDLTLSRTLRDEQGQLTSLSELAETALGMGQTREARGYLNEVYQLLNTASAALRTNPFTSGNINYTEAWVALAEGNTTRAWSTHQEAAKQFALPPGCSSTLTSSCSRRKFRSQCITLAAPGRVLIALLRPYAIFNSPADWQRPCLNAP